MDLTLKLQLSILEYRQRKQTVSIDGNDVHKEENSTIESPPRCQTGGGGGGGHSSTRENLLSVNKSCGFSDFSEVTVNESLTDLSTDGD